MSVVSGGPVEPPIEPQGGPVTGRGGKRKKPLEHKPSAKTHRVAEDHLKPSKPADNEESNEPLMNRPVVSGGNIKTKMPSGKAMQAMKGQVKSSGVVSDDEETPQLRKRGASEATEKPTASKKARPRETLEEDELQTKLNAIDPPPTKKQQGMIREKYEQLKNRYSSFEVHRKGGKLLTQDELLNTAIYTVLVLPKIEIVAERVLHPEETGLARPLIVSEKGAFLLADHKVSLIKGQGTFKSASSAIDLLSDQSYVLLKTRTIEELKTILTKRGLKGEELNEELVKIINKALDEGEMQRELLGERGVIPCHLMMNYNNGQIAFIVEPANGDLHQHLFQEDDPRIETQKAAVNISLGEQVTVMADLAHGLRATHAKGITHGDIKGENIGVKIEDGKIISAGLMDFGEAFRNGDWSASEQFGVGLYGTVGYTPPELFGHNEEHSDGAFKGDTYKTDVWGMGMSMYQMLYGEDPPWKKDIFIYHDEKYNEEADRYIEGKDLNKIRKDFNNSVKSTIENRRTALLAKQKKEGLDIREEMELVVCDTLRLNPKDRITAEEMAERMDVIQERMSAGDDVPPLV